jgi:two-component system chemotaxis response regulator CheB
MIKSQQSNQISFSSYFFDIVAIGASRDGIKAISRILSELTVEFPLPIVIVEHLSPLYISHLAEIFARRTKLTVKQAENGELLQPGVVYIAVPNYHLLVNKDYGLTFSETEKEHFVRPAVNVLFTSVAEIYQQRAIAIILTGGDSDGATGVQAIKQMGGTVIAQDEATSTAFGMPSAAIATGCVDFILPIDQIAKAIVNLVNKGAIE